MSVWEILLLSVALAMDACAVAMTDGMTNPKMPVWKALIIGLFFGFFQFLMPVIGYFITGVVAAHPYATFHPEPGNCDLSHFLEQLTGRLETTLPQAEK